MFGFRAARKRNGREVIPTVLLPKGEQVDVLDALGAHLALKTQRLGRAETLLLTELDWKGEGGKNGAGHQQPTTFFCRVEVRSGEGSPIPGFICGWCQWQGAPTLLVHLL